MGRRSCLVPHAFAVGVAGSPGLHRSHESMARGAAMHIHRSAKKKKRGHKKRKGTRNWDTPLGRYSPRPVQWAGAGHRGRDQGSGAT